MSDTLNATFTLSHYEDLISLRQLSPGRIIFASGLVLEVIAGLRAEAVAAGVPLPADQETALSKLETRLTEARTSAQSALKIDGERETLLAAATLAKPLPALKPTDALADRLLVGFQRACKQAHQDFPPNHPRFLAATTLTHNLFPNGIREITHIPAVDQLAKMHRFLELCATTLQDQIQTLALSDLLDRLKLVTQDYALALQPLPTAPHISGAQVIDAKRTANALLRRVVSVVLGYFDEPTDMPLRQKLLLPILTQHDAAKRARKLHQTDTDIDPTTGIELPPPSTIP